LKNEQAQRMKVFFFFLVYQRQQIKRALPRDKNKKLPKIVIFLHQSINNALLRVPRKTTLSSNFAELCMYGGKRRKR